MGEPPQLCHELEGPSGMDLGDLALGKAKKRSGGPGSSRSNGGKKAKSKGPMVGDQDEEMEDGVGFTLTWITFSIKVPFRPDGRKCRTCPRKDSDEDVVSKTALKISEQMWWGYPPTHQGTTEGYQCGYCKRIFMFEQRTARAAFASAL